MLATLPALAAAPARAQPAGPAGGAGAVILERRRELASDAEYPYADLESLYLEPRRRAGRRVSTLGVATFFGERIAGLDMAFVLMSGHGLGASLPVWANATLELEALVADYKARPKSYVFAAKGTLRDFPGGMWRGNPCYLDAAEYDVVIEMEHPIARLSSGRPAVTGAKDCTRRSNWDLAKAGLAGPPAAPGGAGAPAPGPRPIVLDSVSRDWSALAGRQVAVAAIMHHAEFTTGRAELRLADRFGGEPALLAHLRGLDEEQKKELLQLAFPPSAILVRGRVVSQPPGRRPTPGPGWYLEGESYEPLCRGSEVAAEPARGAPPPRK